MEQVSTLVTASSRLEISAAPATRLSQSPHQVQDFSPPHQLPVAQLKSLYIESLPQTMYHSSFLCELRHIAAVAHEVHTPQVPTRAL